MLQAGVEAGVVAAAPAEPIMAFLNPLVVSTQAWEAIHAATGLPWWASIPLTTVALRTLLLPFTIKAKAATVNFALIQQASNSASMLAQQMGHEAQGASAGASSSTSTSSKDGSAAKGSSRAAPAPAGQAAPSVHGSPMQRLRLAAKYYRYLRRQHHTPSMWWYNSNVLLQVWGSLRLQHIGGGGG